MKKIFVCVLKILQDGQVAVRRTFPCKSIDFYTNYYVSQYQGFYVVQVVTVSTSLLIHILSLFVIYCFKSCSNHLSKLNKKFWELL